MVSALKGKPTYPRIPIEENDMKSFSVAAAFSPEKCRKNLEVWYNIMVINAKTLITEH